jgi:hypothetical protein
MLTYSEARSLMESARHPANGKPLQNNTRLYERTRSDPRNDSRVVTVYAVRLHDTDIIVIYPDFWELNANGWTTITTQDRINSWSPAHVASNYRGDGWMLPIANQAPEPARGQRTIPHPFHAVDPGPEPIKDPEGCIADTKVEREFQAMEVVYDWAGEEQPDDDNPRAFVTLRDHYQEGKLVRVRHHAAIERIHYGANGWGSHAPRYEYRQCPHCKSFYDRHRRWHELMHGPGWGRYSGQGWTTYRMMMDIYGSRAEWLEAAREDLRELKAANKVWREWYYANHVPFHDGICVNSNGDVLRKAAERYFKRQRAEERAARKRQREQEARERHVRHMARLRSGYMQRRAAREPKFERLAAQIATDIASTRRELATLVQGSETET